MPPAPPTPRVPQPGKPASPGRPKDLGKRAAVLVRPGVNGAPTESLFETDLPYLAGGAPQPEFTL